MSHQSGYRDSHAIRQLALWLLYARIACSLLLIWYGLEIRAMLEAAQTGGFDAAGATRSALAAAEANMLRVSRFELILTAVCGLAILMWIHRACFNARVRDAAGVPTPGWAVGCYFIPVASFWLPLVAMREIWASTAGQAGKPNDGGVLLGTWWTLWLARALVGVAFMAITLDPKTIDDFLELHRLLLCLRISTVLLCVVFIVMMRRLTALQELAFQEPPFQPAEMPAQPG